MLNKLKLKFVLVIMLTVTLVLTGAFSAIYTVTENNFEKDSIEYMERLLISSGSPMGSSYMPFDEGTAYICVRLGKSGGVYRIECSPGVSTGTAYFTELVNELVIQAQTTGDNSGTIKDYNVRYLKQETASDISFVFADASDEFMTLRHLSREFAVIGSGVLVMLTVLSILFANWAIKPVESAWEQQKQFVADASHELKTPLTVIMTNSELITSGQCEEEQTQKLSQNIQTMSKQMKGLVEEMLDLARMDAQSRKKEMVNVSLTDIVCSEGMMFEPVFFEKGKEFEYSAEENIYIRGAEGTIRELIEILLDNAAKYGEQEGKVRLSLKKISHKKCIIEVANTGEPFTKEEAEQLFKRFYRGDKARAMNCSYGLGLSIAKSIAEDHGGNMSVTGKDGWNIFSAELPIIKQK